MTRIVRTLPGDVLTEIEQQHTRPFHLVKLMFPTGTLYLSEETQISWSGQTYLESAIKVNEFQWDGDGEQNGSIDLLNDANSASALVLGNGITDIPIQIYSVLRKADGSHTTPILYINGVCNGVRLTTRGASIDVVTSRGKTEFVPNRYFTPEEGFNFLSPVGTIAQWQGEKFILGEEG